MALTAAETQPLKALVVDDSRLARATLSKMLRAEELEVDTAESAEEALEYLSTTKPDVVFLDQNMPGMNGLDALKAIKANPATATIPVMMYTSETAGVYLSQARALGAFDVLVKEDLKAVDIRRRLRELRLRPHKQATAWSLHSVPERPARRPEPASEVFSADQQNHIQHLLREERKQWQQDGATETQQQVHLQTSGSAGRIPEDYQPEKPPVPPADHRNIWPWAVGLLGVGLLFWGISINQRTPPPPTQPKEVAVAPPAQPQVENKKVAAVANTQVAKETMNTDALLAGLEWAVNQRMEYAFDEQPLSGMRLIQLQTLLTYLADANFVGDVQLRVHRGNFCLGSGQDGNPVLPAKNSLYSQCNTLDPSQVNSTSDLQSVEFATFVNSSPLANGDRGIHVIVSTAADTRSQIRYPLITPELTAGEWNAVAARNNHVSVRLIPE
ncbi:MAG TPA: response regulator [Chromatiales bacterium]|nr:response regulator [Thiotrichales bacterium]HIP68160.1 response regulator [Chromatiales bacterium]